MIILTPKADYRFFSRHGEDDPSYDHDLDYKVIKETWVENVYQISADDFWDTGIFIDIGANIGSVCIWAASLNDDREKGKPKIEVIAYEPEPHNLEYLYQNIDENKVSNRIKVHEKAIWTDDGKMQIYNRGGNSSLSGTGDDSTEVKVITLEEVFTDNQIEGCDVLKMDIEGAEYPIMSSASEETLKRIKYLTLEFDGGHEDEFGAMITNLAKVFGIQILGSPERGGYIYGRRY